MELLQDLAKELMRLALFAVAGFIGGYLFGFIVDVLM